MAYASPAGSRKTASTQFNPFDPLGMQAVNTAPAQPSSPSIPAVDPISTILSEWSNPRNSSDNNISFGGTPAMSSKDMSTLATAAGLYGNATQNSNVSGAAGVLGLTANLSRAQSAEDALGAMGKFGLSQMGPLGAVTNLGMGVKNAIDTGKYGPVAMGTISLAAPPLGLLLGAGDLFSKGAVSSWLNQTLSGVFGIGKADMNGSPGFGMGENAVSGGFGTTDFGGDFGGSGDPASA